MYWHSQNVSDTALEFTLLKHKPITFGGVNAAITRYTQHLFDIARGPYVAFGNTERPQALVFQIVRTKKDTLLSLVPRASYLPLLQNPDMLGSLFSQHKYKLGPKLTTVRFRFSQQPAIQRDIADGVLEVGALFGWTQVAVDGRRKLHNTETFIQDLNSNQKTIHDNFILSYGDVGERPVVPALTPNVAYFIAKRKLETFMLNNDIQENPQNDQFSSEFHDELLLLYTTWLHAMIALEDIPHTLSAALRPSTSKEECELALENNTNEWCAYFMKQDTKYPVLVAGAYLWRIAHWLTLREA